MLAIRRQVGFAMVEVMVTVVIITIGISGIGLLLMRAIQGTQDSAQQSQAIWIVQDYIGRMRANPQGARASSYVLDPADIDCDNQPAKICSEKFNDEDGPDLCESPTDMATFDNWITTCSLDSNTYDSASDFIVNPALTSTCTIPITRGSATDCVQYEVQLTWETKVKKGGKTEADRTYQNNYQVIVEFN